MTGRAEEETGRGGFIRPHVREIGYSADAFTDVELAWALWHLWTEAQCRRASRGCSYTKGVAARSRGRAALHVPTADEVELALRELLREALDGG